MMELSDLWESMVEGFESTGRARSVYGEPVERENKTIVPVARVRYGFGGGNAGNVQARGLGGGITVSPVGVLEITPEATRYVPLNRWRRRIAAGVVGLSLGLAVGWLLLRWK